MPLFRRAAASVVAAFAIASSGCGSGNQLSPTLQSRSSYAQIIGVTYPESLEVGELATFTIHWLPVDCSERLVALEFRNDSARGSFVEVRTRQAISDFRCPAGDACVSRDTSFQFRVAAPGALPLYVSGLYGAVRITWDALPAAGSPEHFVEVRRRGTEAYIPGLSLSYRSSTSPQDILGAAVTDSVGQARLTPKCPTDPAARIWLIVDDPGWGCGIDILSFDHVNAPCVRALHTILLYGPKPLPPDAPSSGTSALAARESQ